MKSFFRNFSGALLVGALIAGCGESHSADTDGGSGITFDATPRPDAGPGGEDAGGPTGDIGRACASDGDCEGVCIPDSEGWTGGYCTAFCGEGVDCPAGSTCTPVGGGTSYCLANCEPGASTRQCRAGYGCAQSFMLPAPVCIPGCIENSDCPAGRECNPEGGFAGEGVCFDPTASFGDACLMEEDCPSGGYCYGERFSGWPGGACIGIGCDVATNSGCEGDAQCLPGGGGGGGGLCIDGCVTDDDCRDAYRCVADDDYPDRKYCGPGCTTNAQCSGSRVCNPALGTCASPFNPDELGSACSTDRRACRGGTCLTEFESGLPGSYCSYTGCDPTLADGAGGADGCPGDGVCVDAGSAGLCLDGCTADTDCRADYRCRPSDPADPSSATACVAACDTDAACANDGFECNVGTGLCRPPFSAAQIGEPCTETSEACAAGECLSEEEDGWPAGTCAFPGCRLSGTGPAEECPTGTVCVDDGEGDPTLGFCLDACVTTTTTGCRPGYACVALTGTDGACRPACTAGDCGSGRTCNTTTGLCE